MHKLRELEISSNQITEIAANHIAEVVSCNNKLESLWLNDNQFKALGIQTICRSLCEISSLKLLNLNNNCITKEVANDIAAVISNNPLLTFVYVGNNNLKSLGIIKIANKLKTLSLLKFLDFEGNQITEDATNHIAEVIYNNNEELGNDLAQVFANNPLLETVDISHNNLKTQGIIRLCSSLQDLNQLKELRLGSNGIDERAADGIAAVIHSNPLLTGFDIGFNQLKSNGIIIIANALKKISCLKILSFNNNQFTEAAANDIAQVIANNNQIEEIYLNDNELKATGIKKICKSLRQISTLKALGLGNNFISEEAAGDIAIVIDHNPLLESIDISNNSLKSNGMIIIARALKKLFHLINLWFNSNHITEDAGNDIGEMVAGKNKLKQLSLNNDKLKAIGTQRICKHLRETSTLTLLYETIL